MSARCVAACGLFGKGLLLVLLCPAASGAEGVLVKPEVYASAIANHYTAGGESTSFDQTAMTGELTFVAPSRRYWGGPFIDYRYSSVRRFDDSLNLGAYFRYNWPRWDATTWLFVNRSSGNDDTWLYSARLRYLVAPGHKIGGEAMAPVDRDADRPRLMFGYYGSLSRSLSLNVLAGMHTAGLSDVVARMELVWRIH